MAPLTHTIPLSPFQQEFWSSFQCLAVDLCICFHQVLDEGYMMTIRSSIWLKGKVSSVTLHCWWEWKLVQLPWKSIWQFLRKLGINLPQDQAILLFGHIPKESSTIPQGHLFSYVFSSIINNIHNLNRNTKYKPNLNPNGNINPNTDTNSNPFANITYNCTPNLNPNSNPIPNPNSITLILP